ncbi:MAG: amidohydrolase family protein [Armatimonadota bacterium]|nr:amidohydrolase family protein [Armatimonadota bacterium]MDR7515764.1 amidohydrolase family protein [Armatimonadota bacterium]MDR7560684.1 amidohydrolase family protein [Armatimonadota bacterium]MDR7582249.1 amidohydrolase family protein [Armatimonadota bacterium]MDR7612714.1 amidohydrolase family protein [Armatimonadota bacterium]
MTSAFGIPLLDFHAHFPHPDEDLWGAWGRAYAARRGQARLDLLTRRNYQAQVEWWRRWSFPLPEQLPVGEAVRRWAREVDRYGLEAIVFVTGGGNDALAEICRAHPRFVGFAHHDPFSPRAADELRRAVRELGLRGYKILAPSVAGALDDPALDPVWEACEELQIPVLVHFGPLSGGGGIAYSRNISPLALHDVAKGFPTVPFVIPHFGCGYPTELLLRLQQVPLPGARPAVRRHAGQPHGALPGAHDPPVPAQHPAAPDRYPAGGGVPLAV